MTMLKILLNSLYIQHSNQKVGNKLTESPINFGLESGSVLLPMHTWMQKPIFINSPDSYAGITCLDNTCDSEKHPR